MDPATLKQLHPNRQPLLMSMRIQKVAVASPGDSLETCTAASPSDSLDAYTVASSRDSLGDLYVFPLEIREEIYAFVLSFNLNNYPPCQPETNLSTSDGDPNHNTPPRARLLSLLYASKAISREAERALVRVTDFEIFINRVDQQQSRWGGVPRAWTSGSTIRMVPYTESALRGIWERSVFSKKGLMKDVKYLTLNIGAFNGVVRAEDLQESDPVQIANSEERELQLKNVLRRLIDEFKGSSLKRFTLRIPCQEKMFYDVKYLLDVVSSFRLVHKLGSDSLTFQNQWYIPSDYEQFLASTMGLPWGVEGLVWDRELRRGVEPEQIEAAKEVDEGMAVDGGKSVGIRSLRKKPRSRKLRGRK